jgi:mRNA interferase MazF
MLRQASRFDDWLVCMVSSQVHQAEINIDEIISPTDTDFVSSGLKVPSLFRLSRLAVLDGSLMLGSIGEISDKRLEKVRSRLATWITSVD